MKYKLSKYLLFTIDIAIVIFAFLFAAKVKPGTLRIIQTYYRSFIPFISIWIGISLWGGKYDLKSVKNGSEYLRRIFKCNIISILIVLGIMYVLNRFYYSRLIVFGTILGTFAIELFVFLGWFYALRFHKENATFASTGLITRSRGLEDAQTPKFFLESATVVPVLSSEPYAPSFSSSVPVDALMLPLWQKYLKGQDELFSFLNDFLDLSRFSLHESLILNSETYFNIQNEAPLSRQLFINLHKINDFRRINLYLIKVNEMLQAGGVFVCNGQTIAERRNGFLERYTPYLGIVLYIFDFVIRRVFPKLPILQGWYFALTNGKNRALSETEMLGRFYFCGFDLIHKKEIDGRMNFILRKVREPRIDPNPTYGPFIQLKRKGQHGKTIYIKKFRTMHPYSEYLQDYVYRTSDLQEGGKFKDDFRVTSWGRILRKLWIDELPQFHNFFRGELALVGVRALSEHYFGLYPKDMQELRLKVKPGLIPPFYADMPKTFEDIVESERRYVLRKLEKPFHTDWVYFWKAVWNILIKKARSN